MDKRFTTPLLQTVAGVWAAALMLCGLATLFGASAWVPLPTDSPAAPLRGVVGVSLLLGAQVVFLCFVADRAFPEADRRVVLGTEFAVSAAFVLGVVWLAWRALGLMIGGPA